MEVTSINDLSPLLSPTPIDVEEPLPINTVYIKDEVQGKNLDSPVESLVNYCQICENQFESEVQFESHMCHLMITINTDLTSMIGNGLDKNVIQYRCNPIKSSDGKASLSNSNVNQSHNNNTVVINNNHNINGINPLIPTSSNCNGIDNHPDFYIIQLNTADSNQLTNADNFGNNIINPITSTSNGIDSQTQFFDPDDLVFMNRFKICLPKLKISDMPVLEPIITKPYLCEICNRDCDTKTALMEHQKYHKFPCKLCNVTFASKETLINHMQVHKEIEIRDVDTEKLKSNEIDEGSEIDCSKSSSSDGIEIPINRNEIDKKRYMSIRGCWFFCKICNISNRYYSCERNLVRHLIQAHATPFRNEIDKKRYMSIEGSLFFCNICSRYYSYERNLVRHLVRAHAIPLNVIDKSVENSPGNNSETKDLLRWDEESSTFYEYKCKYCMKILSTQFNILKHIKSVHKISQMYACKRCKSTSQTFSDIQDHVFMHLIESDMEPIDYINCITFPYEVIKKGELVTNMNLVNHNRIIKSSPLQSQSIPLQNQSIPLQSKSIPLQSISTPLLSKLISSQNKSIPGSNESNSIPNKIVPLHINSIPSQFPDGSVPNTRIEKKIFLITIKPNLVPSMLNQSQTTQSIPFDNSQLTSEIHIKNEPDDELFEDCSIPSAGNEIEHIQIKTEFIENNPIASNYSIDIENIPIVLAGQVEKGGIDASNEIDSNVQIGNSLKIINATAVPQDVKKLLAKKQSELRNEIDKNERQSRIDKKIIDRSSIKVTLQNQRYSSNSNGIDSNGKNTSNTNLNESDPTTRLLVNNLLKHCNVIDTIENTSKPIKIDHLNQTELKQNGMNAKIIAVWDNIEMDSSGNPIKPKIGLFCTICKINFFDKNTLMEHMKTHKSVCTICNMHFQRKCNLTKHMRSHALLHRCMICGEHFSNLSEYNSHLRTHPRPRLRKWDGCNQNFGSKKLLKQHHRQLPDHAIGYFKCDVCGEEFRDEQQKINHLKLHLEHYAHACSLCGQRFEKKRNLSKHLREHESERFTCDICDKHFTDGHAFKRHEATHFLAERYKCDICNKEFAYSHTLRTHLLSHYNNPITSNEPDTNPSEAKKLKLIHIDAVTENAAPNSQSNGIENEDDELNIFETTPDIIEIDNSGYNMQFSNENCTITSSHYKPQPKNITRIIRLKPKNKTIKCYNSKKTSTLNSIDKRNAIDTTRKKTTKQQLISKEKKILCNAIDTTDSSSITHKVNNTTVAAEWVIPVNMYQNNAFTENHRIDQTKKIDAIERNMNRCTEFVLNSENTTSNGIENEGTVVEPAIPVNIYENNAIAPNNGIDQTEKIDPIERNTHQKCTKFEFNSKNEGNGIDKIENPIDIETNIDAAFTKELSGSDNIKCNGSEISKICRICKEEFSEKIAFDKHIMKHFEKSKFTCRFCSERFQNKSNFTTHSNKHCGRYMCMLCGEGFRNYSELSLHLKAHHIYDEEYTCYVCDEIFTCGYDLHLHCVTIHNSTNKRSLEAVRYTCDLCQQTFWNNTTLNLHMITHLSWNNQPCNNDKYTCMFCDWSLKDPVEFERHLRLHTVDYTDQLKALLHTNENHEKNDPELSYICELCNAGFTEKRYLDRHIMNHVMKSYKCIRCPMSYANRIKLRAHIKNEHKYEEISNCSICSEKFMYHYQLSLHMEKIHKKNINPSSGTTAENLGNFFCCYCSKTLSCEADRKKHLQITLDANYWVCRVCHQQFAFKHFLRYHMLKQHTSNLTCTVCTKVFMNKQTLGFHMRTHAGRNTHRCEPCQMSFQCGGALTTHRREHRKNQFRCLLCHGIYNNVTTLRAHLQTMHLDQYNSNENGIDSAHSSSECPESNTGPTEDEIDIKENIVNIKCEPQFEIDN